MWGEQNKTQLKKSRLLVLEDVRQLFLSVSSPSRGRAPSLGCPATPRGPLGSISACCLWDLAPSRLAGVRACGALLQVPPSALCCRKSSARLLLLCARSRPGAAAPGVGPAGLGLAPGVLTCSASVVRAAGHLEHASAGRGRDERGLRVPSR